ncbi:MAG TPA: cysteine peptidase family C39 domain-containing protein, partial [Methylobacter sp.]
MSDKFPHTTIQCLTAIAQHHGLQVNPERLIQEYALGAEEPAPATLLRIATEIGLKAKVDKLSWEGLLAQGGVFPILAKLSDENSVIIVGARTEEDGKVAILDPNISG